MKLIPASRVASFIGFEEGVADSEISQATMAASEEIKAALDTDMTAVTGWVDRFHVPTQMSLPQSPGVYRARLALSRGFLTNMASIRMADAYAGLTAGPLVPGANAVVDLTKGEVVLTHSDMAGRYMEVTYDAGFPADDEDADLFDQDSLPEWLKQAATLKAVVILDSTHPKLRMESGADKSVDQLSKTISAILMSKLRYFPSAVRPLV